MVNIVSSTQVTRVLVGNPFTYLLFEFNSLAFNKLEKCFGVMLDIMPIPSIVIPKNIIVMGGKAYNLLYSLFLEQL